jgi:hypothetical protein
VRGKVEIYRGCMVCEAFPQEESGPECLHDGLSTPSMVPRKYRICGRQRLRGKPTWGLRRRGWPFKIAEWHVMALHPATQVRCTPTLAHGLYEASSRYAMCAHDWLHAGIHAATCIHLTTRYLAVPSLTTCRALSGEGRELHHGARRIIHDA